MVNEFINSFSKGLNSDVNVVLQPDGTYRFMKNCQLINQDGNNYVIKDCLGNVKTFTINPPYLLAYPDIDPVYPFPIGFISFPDRLIVFSTNNSQDTGGYGEIGQINYLPYGEGVQPVSVSGEYNAGYVPLYHSIDLNFKWQKRIDGFGFVENDLIQRVYWTDNFNEPRVFNVTDPIFTTYFATGTLVVGQSYMVLEGAIRHNGIDYGPGLPDTNVFEAQNANYTNLSGTAPTPKVIQYYPHQLLNFTPDRPLGEIKFSQYFAGNLICGSKVYYYRLLSDSGIPPTSWSYGSFPVPVGTKNEYLTGDTYHDFVGAGTTIATANSGLAVQIIIDNIDTNFDYIEVACSEFDQLIDAPRQTTIIARQEIGGTTMGFEHTGDTNLGNLSYPTDFTTFPAAILRCKTMATSKNYNLIGNIEERGPLDWDVSAATIDQFQYPVNCHYDADSCSLSGMVPTGFNPTANVNPTSGNIRPWERYVVLGGGTVTYNAVVYSPGYVFVGVVGVTTFTTTGTPVIRPCVTRNRYNTSGGARVENYISLTQNTPYGSDVFWDYTSAAMHTHCASYWSNEIYRIGILPWDLKGRPYPVIHLGDYTFDNVLAKGGLLRSDAFGADLVYSLNPSGLKIDNIIIPAEIASQISGFSIVRAIRDPRIVCQGLVTQNTSTGSPAVYHPGAWIPIDLDASATVASRFYTGIFPDLLVDCPLKSDVGVPGDSMESAFWMDAYDYSAGVRVRGSDFQGAAAGSEQVYSKLITSLSADTTERTTAITYWAEVNEDEVIGDDPLIPNEYLGAGVTYANNMTTAAAGVNVEGACVSGAADYTLNSYSAVGCKKIVFKGETDFLHYGPAAYDYTSSGASARADTEKIIMNYVKSGKSEFYGPLGDTVYISTGHYQAIDDALRANTYDVVTDSYILDNIEVFGGDCFPSLVDIGYGLWDTNDANGYSYAWTFPCECNSNYNLRRGRKTSNVGMWYTGIPATSDAIVFDNGTTDHLEDYSYNQGYSAENFAVAYPTIPEDYISPTQFNFRIRFAGEKFIGEETDSFRTFAVLDYKDIDGSAGRINNIKVKDGRVIVWQDKMVTTVPILERQLLAAPLGDPTTIGTGGVVDRFDPLNSYFGNQHQWSLIETEFGWCWFDMRRKAFLEMTISGGILEVSQVLGLQQLFNEAFVEVIGNQVIDDDNILNSPTFSETSDQPLMGVGIHGVYDPKTKMTYMNFKFKIRKVVSAADVYKAGDFTIGYLHSNTDRMFVGFYDWFPAIAHNHNQIVLSANNPKTTSLFVTTPVLSLGTVFAVGDTVIGQNSGGTIYNSEYICILAFTYDNVAKAPLGASGATYWVEVNRANELFVLNQPATLGLATAPDYQHNKFDGKVVSNELQWVVNPKAPSFYVGNMEQYGLYNTNYTDIYTSTSSQTASDVSIRSTDRNYRNVFNKIQSSLPRASNGARLVDNYLLVRGVKKNYTTNPTVITTSVKILEFVKSFFTLRR